MFNNKAVLTFFTIFVLLISVSMTTAEDKSSGSAKLTVPSELYAAGTKIPAGQYDVKWEVNAQEASVIFNPIGKPTGIKVQGRIVQLEKKMEYNSLMTGKDSAGRAAIRALVFSGKMIRIEFD
jgi:hypothetical protein